MSCAVFTFIGIYALITNQSSKWIVTASFIAAIGMFLVASFLAWHDEHKNRLNAEAQLNEKLKNKLLRVTLSQFLIQGQDIHDLCVGDADLSDVKDKADTWHDAIREYLLANADVSYVARFVTLTSGIMTSYEKDHVVGKRNIYRIALNGYMDILREFIKELNV